MKSLRTRLLVVATLILVVFMLLCGAGLDQAFRSTSIQVQRDKQQGLIFALLGTAEFDDDGSVRINAASLPDLRLGRVQSGLEALVFNERGKVIWRSPSFSGTVPELLAPEVGASLFSEFDERFAMTYGVRWVTETSGLRFLGGGKRRQFRYTVAIMEDKADYHAQLKAFRRVLWTWLGGAAVALILVQVAVLSWGLAPLRKLVRELRGVESGQQSRIEAGYPDELTPLAEGLNTMIAAERNQQGRYRNALDDLAHSLKTPLAVLRGLLEDNTLAGRCPRQDARPGRPHAADHLPPAAQGRRRRPPHAGRAGAAQAAGRQDHRRADQGLRRQAAALRRGSRRHPEGSAPTRAISTSCSATCWKTPPSGRSPRCGCVPSCATGCCC